MVVDRTEVGEAQTQGHADLVCESTDVDPPVARDQRRNFRLGSSMVPSSGLASILLLFALLVALAPVGRSWSVVAFFTVLMLISLGAGLVNVL